MRYHFTFSLLRSSRCCAFQGMFSLGLTFDTLHRVLTVDRIQGAINIRTRIDSLPYFRARFLYERN